MPVSAWSTTALSNSTVGSINFAEGQAPSTVNNSARALMADVASWRLSLDLAGPISLTGSVANPASTVRYIGTGTGTTSTYYNALTSGAHWFTVAGTTIATMGANGLDVRSAAWTVPVALTVAATTTVTCTASNVFTAAMTTNITTLTVSSPASGQTISIRFTQDATGSRTVAWPAAFDWVGGAVPVLSTTAAYVDLLVATYFSDTGLWLC